VRAIATLRQTPARGVAGLVVGDGPELDGLQRLAAELGIMEHMRFHRTRSARQDPRLLLADRHLHRAAVAISASAARDAAQAVRSDGDGDPAPRVGTSPRCGEIAAPGERGLVFHTPKIPRGLADAAEQLIADPEMRERFGASARDWVTRERTVGRATRTAIVNSTTGC